MVAIPLEHGNSKRLSSDVRSKDFSAAARLNSSRVESRSSTLCSVVALDRLRRRNVVSRMLFNFISSRVKAFGKVLFRVR
jgi:hypothetical protein